MLWVREICMNPRKTSEESSTGKSGQWAGSERGGAAVRRRLPPGTHTDTCGARLEKTHISGEKWNKFEDSFEKTLMLVLTRFGSVKKWHISERLQWHSLTSIWWQNWHILRWQRRSTFAGTFQGDRIESSWCEKCGAFSSGRSECFWGEQQWGEKVTHQLLWRTAVQSHQI